jgi:hypothetical protein
MGTTCSQEIDIVANDAFKALGKNKEGDAALAKAKNLGI